jgi:hypothetical protein
MSSITRSLRPFNANFIFGNRSCFEANKGNGIGVSFQ